MKLGSKHTTVIVFLTLTGFSATGWIDVNVSRAQPLGGSGGSGPPKFLGDPLNFLGDPQTFEATSL